MITENRFEQFFKQKGEFKNLEFTLNRIKNACDQAGINDNISKNTIHIAGTNGKGSTASFISQILRHRGLSTALFTSPHIHSVTERISVDDTIILDSDFDKLFVELEDIISQNNLSYFETLTLIAFKYFKYSMPDVAIIETGLGGRLDSTNVLDKKIPVITSISLDHVEFLGSDILGIAREKLAIVKDNQTIFLGHNTEQVNEFAYNHLSSKEIVTAKYSEENYYGFKNPFANNLKLAEKVADYICEGDMPQNLNLPFCRMEQCGQFILDGAHNEDALNKLFQQLDTKPVTIFSSTSDRETRELLEIVQKHSEKVILTEIPFNERSVDINNIKTSAIKEKEPEKAVKIAVELSGNTDILVCGSLYLCAYIRGLVK